MLDKLGGGNRGDAARPPLANAMANWLPASDAAMLRSTGVQGGRDVDREIGVKSCAARQCKLALCHAVWKAKHGISLTDPAAGPLICANRADRHWLPFRPAVRESSGRAEGFPRSKRLRARAGRRRHSLRCAELAGPGGRAIVRRAHRPACEAGIHSAHPLKRPEHLVEVKLIKSNVSVVQWSDWFGAFTAKRAPDRFSVRFDRAQMSLDGAMQGLGVPLKSATIAGRHIAEGKLHPVFGQDNTVQVKAHFAVYPARHAKRLPVEAFLQTAGPLSMAPGLQAWRSCWGATLLPNAGGRKHPSSCTLGGLGSAAGQSVPACASCVCCWRRAPPTTRVYSLAVPVAAQ